MGSGREIWFDGRAIPFSRQDIWGLVNQSAIQNVLVSIQQRQEGYFPQKTRFITEVKGQEDLLALSAGEIVASVQRDLLAIAAHKGMKTCAFFSIEDREALEDAWKEAANYDYAVVDFDLPTNIPLELILARLADRGTVILRQVSSVEEMEVAFGVLERGSDGVLFASMELNEIDKLSGYMSASTGQRLELQALKVTEVRHIGMGVRSCVDTTGLMTREEGMLVGSTSSGGIFVCSETHYLPYMNLRPFRVNAGAVHSYIWMPNDIAEYLTDLQTGSQVLCVNIRGETRILTVGRVKSEVRPLLLIKGIVGDVELNVIVQDDWHIRLMGADYQPKNATQIKPGDQLLAYLSEPGRHVGIKVQETILEK